MFRVISLFITTILISFPLMAKDKPILTLYTYSSFMSEWGPGAKIKTDFEAQCDCLLNVVSVDDGVMILNRLRLEGRNTKADVIVGLDNNLISQARHANLVQAHQLSRPENLVVDWWQDDFVPYDYGYYAFIYNQDKVVSPPKSFDELFSQPNWKIVYQDPRTSTPGFGLLLWMNKIYGDKALQAWQKLAKQTLTVTKGWSESYGLFLKDEVDFVLSYNTSPAVHIMNDNDHRYKAAIFDEGNYQQIEVAAITRYSKHVEIARQFMAFLLTPGVQQELVEKNIMYPIVDIVLPGAYQELNKVTTPLSFSADEVFNNQKQWIKQWQDAVSQ